ncbi:MAG TPA: M3 family metallopeptidase, partial [Pseudobdellovibrionaceae bacterium]|nr:M3 family metallopeptidase [Pseudobdellovibrionaceae bacterium]
MVEIQNIAARLDDLNIDATEKLWAQYTTGLDFGVDEAQKKVRAFLQDKDNYKTICKSSETEKTPLDRRRIEILMKQFRPYHHSAHANTLKSEIDAFETKLGEVLNKHRTIVDGLERSSAEVSRILGESDDREMRKRTYLAQASINEELVDNGFLELIQLRQAYAQEIGYHNFIELRADQDDLGPNFFDGWLDQTAQYQRFYHELSGKVAKRFLGHEDLQPWDLRYLQNLLSERNRHIVDLSSFQTILAKVFRQFGFEIDRLPITYDIFPRRNKSE